MVVTVYVVPLVILITRDAADMLLIIFSCHFHAAIIFAADAASRATPWHYAGTDACCFCRHNVRHHVTTSDTGFHASSIISSVFALFSFFFAAIISHFASIFSPRTTLSLRFAFAATLITLSFSLMIFRYYLR